MLLVIGIYIDNLYAIENNQNEDDVRGDKNYTVIYINKNSNKNPDQRNCLKKQNRKSSNQVNKSLSTKANQINQDDEIDIPKTSIFSAIKGFFGRFIRRIFKKDSFLRWFVVSLVKFTCFFSLIILIVDFIIIMSSDLPSFLIRRLWDLIKSIFS